MQAVTLYTELHCFEAIYFHIRPSIYFLLSAQTPKLRMIDSTQLLEDSVAFRLSLNVIFPLDLFLARLYQEQGVIARLLDSGGEGKGG